MNAARHSKRLLAALVASSIAVLDVHAAVTDIYTQPLATTSSVVAKPNIMFILDNSGSMESDYMPDDMDDTSTYGWASAQCNGVAFDPNYGNYVPPVKADGTSYPNADFEKALSDGYAYVGNTGVRTSSTSVAVAVATNVVFTLDSNNTGWAAGDAVAIGYQADGSNRMTGTVVSWDSSSKKLTVNITSVAGSGTYNSWTVSHMNSLSGSVYYTYKSSGTQKAMSWTYNTSGVIKDTFYNECNSKVGNTPGSNVFTKVTITSADTAALKQSYANWYAYYRTRRLLMRTATGQAFNALSDRYRVGFTVISDTKAKQGNNWFLDVNDYDSTQKAAFYKSLYTAVGNSYTPLRASLAKVGRYFANKAPEQTSDPMQYSCQRNYTILSTDGYWNTNTESTTYGPFLADKDQDLGQQDGKEALPMRDGTTTNTKTVTTETTTWNEQVTTHTANTATKYQRWAWTIGAATSCGGSAGRVLTQQQQQRTEVVYADKTDTRKVDSKKVTTTVVDADGVVISNSVTGPTNTYTTLTSGTATNTTDAGTWSGGGLTTYNGCATDTTLTSKGISKTNGTVVYSKTAETDGTCGTSCDYQPITADPGVNIGAGTKPATTSNTTPLTTASTTTDVQVTTTETGGTNTTLADVAEYYYATDLRSSAFGNCTSGSSGKDVCANDTLKPIDLIDTATHQHMTTFTIGLGVNGTLAYDPNYQSQSSGAYKDLSTGKIKWPDPMPKEGAIRIDDLWHAAVNGRGRYFATKNADTLSNALSGALTQASKAVGSAAGAATNSLEPVVGDNNRAYIATYTTLDWAGDITAYPLDATTGNIDTADSSKVWSAQKQLEAISANSRKIKYMKPGSTVLKDFNFTNLNGDGYGANFKDLCKRSPAPQQCAGLAAASDQTNFNLSNDGDNLVNFLRGDDKYEVQTNTAQPLFRERTAKLGDIINASPAYVKKSPLEYGDTGHATYVGTTASRRAMLYAAANDGMLHAFDAGTGNEQWAFVPSFVMPNMWRLADTNYRLDHRYFVDGTPVIGDIYTGSAWKTILVGGLNSGGRGYYALDITDPDNPAAMWEFTDTNMGLTYGNPVITKRKDGKWVVMVASGLNNADGLGHLYQIDAATGTKLNELKTNAGSSGTPSGLSKINSWVESGNDNTATRFYGGDMLGNLWRFDFDDLVPPSGTEAVKLALFQIDSSTPQPITTKPQLTVVTDAGGTKVPVVVVATGRYLGTSDVSDTTVQSIYAIKDTLQDTGWGDVRARTDLVSQSVSIPTGGISGTGTMNSVDWKTNIGWKLDLPQSKERVSTDFLLQFNVLTVASAIPGTSECSPAGGSSWIYNINVAKGTAANGTTISQYLGAFLVVGMSSIMDATGKVRQIVVGSDTSVRTLTPPDGELPGATVRRSAWRELVN